MHVRYYLGRNDGSLTFHAPRSVAVLASELAAGLAEAAESKGSVCTFGLKAGYSPASGPFVEFVHGDRLLDAIADGSVSDETCWQDPLLPPPRSDASLLAMRLAARPEAAAAAAELLSAVEAASGGDPAATKAAALLAECSRAAASGDVAALEGMVPALEAAVIREARPPAQPRRRGGGRRKTPP